MQKEIKMIVTAPVDCTEKEYMEWVNYHLSDNGVIATSNPLYLFDLSPDNVKFSEL